MTTTSQDDLIKVDSFAWDETSWLGQTYVSSFRSMSAAADWQGTLWQTTWVTQAQSQDLEANLEMDMKPVDLAPLPTEDADAVMAWLRDDSLDWEAIERGDSWVD